MLLKVHVRQDTHPRVGCVKFRVGEICELSVRLLLTRQLLHQRGGSVSEPSERLSVAPVL